MNVYLKSNGICHILMRFIEAWLLFYVKYNLRLIEHLVVSSRVAFGCTFAFVSRRLETRSGSIRRIVHQWMVGLSWRMVRARNIRNPVQVQVPKRRIVQFSSNYNGNPQIRVKFVKQRYFKSENWWLPMVLPFTLLSPYTFPWGFFTLIGHVQVVNLVGHPSRASFMRTFSILTPLTGLPSPVFRRGKRPGQKGADPVSRRRSRYGSSLLETGVPRKMWRKVSWD